MIREMVFRDIIGLQSALPHRSLTHAPSTMRMGHIDGDVVQPILERALAAKSTEAAKRSNERFLSQVFGIPIAASQGPCKVEHTNLIASYQGVDSIRVTCLRRLDEHPIGIHSETPTPLRLGPESIKVDN